MQVYSCAYQSLVIEAYESCDSASGQPPYVPAPYNAPGSCSCDMGLLYFFTKGYERQYLNDCKQRIKSLQGTGQWVTADDECVCCSDGGALSS